MMTDQMIQICGLWKNQGKKGEYFSGKLNNGVKVLILQNNYKRADNHPDFNMFFCSDSKNGKNKPDNKQGKQKSTPTDDIPF